MTQNTENPEWKIQNSEVMPNLHVEVSVACAVWSLRHGAL